MLRPLPSIINNLSKGTLEPAFWHIFKTVLRDRQSLAILFNFLIITTSGFVVTLVVLRLFDHCSFLDNKPVSSDFSSTVCGSRDPGFQISCNSAVTRTGDEVEF